MYTRGAIVRSIDPFKIGDEAERYWLVLSDDSHPFADEQCIAVACTTRFHEPALPIPETAWLDGGLPERSFASPWAIHSPRFEDISNRVGELSKAFCETVLDEVESYLWPK